MASLRSMYKQKQIFLEVASFNFSVHSLIWSRNVSFATNPSAHFFVLLKYNMCFASLSSLLKCPKTGDDFPHLVAVCNTPDTSAPLSPPPQECYWPVETPSPHHPSPRSSIRQSLAAPSHSCPPPAGTTPHLGQTMEASPRVAGGAVVRFYPTVSSSWPISGSLTPQLSATCPAREAGLQRWRWPGWATTWWEGGTLTICPALPSYLLAAPPGSPDLTCHKPCLVPAPSATSNHYLS